MTPHSIVVRPARARKGRIAVGALLSLALMIAFAPQAGTAAPKKCSGTIQSTSTGVGKTCKFVYLGGSVRVTGVAVGVGVPRVPQVPNFLAVVVQYIYNGHPFYCLGFGPGVAACSKVTKPKGIPVGTILTCIGGVDSWTDPPRRAVAVYRCENV